MVDMFSPAKRSEIMSRIRGKDTTPEMVVRRLVHGLGYRYRLHSKLLPGCPDLVFAGRKKVIFVHGCWWHKHSCRHGQTAAKTNVKFWTNKMEANATRDRKVAKELRRIGWAVLVIWECQTKDMRRLEARLKRYLGPIGSVNAERGKSS